MKFLLAVLVLVAGAWAQDSYNCPDGWLLEVELQYLFSYFHFSFKRRTEVDADASGLVKENP